MKELESIELKAKELGKMETFGVR